MKAQVSVCVSEKIDMRLRDLAHERRTSRSAEARRVLEEWEESEQFTTPEVEAKLSRFMAEANLTRLGAVSAVLVEWARGNAKLGRARSGAKSPRRSKKRRAA